MHKRKTISVGFTIVELLIVIVVIAILAAISIIAFIGIQQRATNSNTIASVNQVLKAISSYTTLNGSYPVPGNNQFCVTPATNGFCTAHSTSQRVRSSVFDNNISTVANLPTSVPNGHAHYMGITANYITTRTVNGESRPLTIQYSLRGEEQQCGFSDILAAGSQPSTTGYTSSSEGYTVCVISIPSL